MASTEVDVALIPALSWQRQRHEKGASLPRSCKKSSGPETRKETGKPTLMIFRSNATAVANDAYVPAWPTMTVCYVLFVFCVRISP